MTSNPITIKPNEPIMEASRIMREHGIRRLPVVDRGKVAGMITHRRLLEASPSEATTLSIHELNYLIANLKVKEVMAKDPLCVSPDDSVIDVVLLGREKGIGSFPVVDQGRLVGIVTETEIYRSFVQLFGDPKTETIISLENIRLRETVGAMSRIASIIEGMDIPVLAMFSMPHRRSEGNRLIIRAAVKDASALEERLRAEGYKLGD
jgi:acetoin utilization protein AcuB